MAQLQKAVAKMASTYNHELDEYKARYRKERWETKKGNLLSSSYFVCLLLLFFYDLGLPYKNHYLSKIYRDIWSFVGPSGSPHDHCFSASDISVFSARIYSTKSRSFEEISVCLVFLMLKMVLAILPPPPPRCLLSCESPQYSRGPKHATCSLHT